MKNVYDVLNESYDAIIENLTELKKVRAARWNNESVEVRMIKEIAKLCCPDYTKTAINMN